MEEEGFGRLRKRTAGQFFQFEWAPNNLNLNQTTITHLQAVCRVSELLANNTLYDRRLGAPSERVLSLVGTTP